MEVRSVLTLTCVLWVCVLLSKGSPQPHRSVGVSHVWLHLKSHLPFSLCPGQAGSSWEPRGDGVSRAGGSPASSSSLHFLGSGLAAGAQPAQGHPKPSCECSVPPLCFRGWAQSPSDRGLGPLGSTSPPCAHGNVVTVNLAFHFCWIKTKWETSHLLEVLIAHSVQRGFMVHAAIILCYCPLKEFC